MTTVGPFANILGERESGQDVRGANVVAVQAVANMLKSSLGPQGLDKMLVDDLGDVLVTNDGATILKRVEVQHPAARLLVELSDLQDREVGDGTTSVVLIAAELLRRGNQLVKNHIHATSVIAGYKLAMRESIRYLKEHLAVNISEVGSSVLTSVARTTLNSKYIGADADRFAALSVSAIQGVKTVTDSGEVRYPVSAINILKAHGRSLSESQLLNGYALPRLTRAAQGMPSRVSDAKIALLDFPLRTYRLQLGVTVSTTDPVELERVWQRERDIAREKVNLILNAGANVVLTTQGIDDLVLKYFVEAGALAVRRVPRKDMQRLARATGGTICISMASLEGGEKFEPSWLGTCSEVTEEPVGDWDCIFFKQCCSSRAVTLVLRGASEPFLDEVERSVHDALSAVSRTLENNTVSPGGGATEAALSAYLSDFALTLGTREQLAVAEFAESLLIIPKTLALNAALDSLDLLSRLRWHHHRSQQTRPDIVETDGSTTTAESLTEKSVDGTAKWVGLDLTEGRLRNCLAAGVVEPTLSKLKAIRFATEAAVTILRIDDVVKLNPSPDDQIEAQRRQMGG